MEKSSSQKALKVISIIVIIFGSLGIVMSLLAMLGGGVLGAAAAQTGENSVAVGGALVVVFAGFALVSSIVDLIVGIFGLRGANNPQKIGVFFVVAIIGVVISALETLAILIGGSLDLSSIASALIGLALPIACVVLANNIKKENQL